MSVIAVFGGTFNPFHIGHYEMLSNICELPYIDRVFVIPDKIPPHKTCEFLANDEDRIEMCRLVCEDFPKTELCLIEFEREGKSYTVDTVKALQQKYPNDTFYIVIGGDMLASLDSWYKWKELIKAVPFIAFSREGIAFDAHLNRLRLFGADITVIDKKITDISSTELRAITMKEMLPEKVYNYIVKKGIYNG